MIRFDGELVPSSGGDASVAFKRFFVAYMTQLSKRGASDATTALVATTHRRPRRLAPRVPRGRKG